jgi:hypothetical protein
LHIPLIGWFISAVHHVAAGCCCMLPAACTCLAWLESSAFVGPTDAFLRICSELAVAVKGSYAAIPTWRYVDPTTYDTLSLAHELRCMCMPLYTGTISFIPKMRCIAHPNKLSGCCVSTPQRSCKMLPVLSTARLCVAATGSNLLGLIICCLRYAVIQQSKHITHGCQYIHCP